MKDGYVYKQHENLYTLNSAASRSFDRFWAAFDALFAMRRDEMSVVDEIECLMVISDSHMKDGYVYEQREHLYT